MTTMTVQDAEISAALTQPPIEFIGDAEEHLKAVREFAESVGALERFEQQLGYLNTGKWFGTTGSILVLAKDFAPYSFAFGIKVNGQVMMNGGLIYSGPGCPANGSFPSLTVSVDPDNGKEHNWSCHT